MATFQSRLIFFPVLAMALAFCLPAIASEVKSTLTMSPQSSFKETKNEKGQVIILVFKKGLPLSGFKIEVPQGRFFETNEDGYLNLELPVGAQKISFPEIGKAVTAQVRNDSETELIVDVKDSDLKASFVEVNEGKADPEMIQSLSDLQGETLTVFVRDASSQNPVQDAQIRIKGYSGQVISDPKGRASIILPKGFHTIFVSESSHSVATREIEVKEESAELLFDLTPQTTELEEFVVLSPQNKGSFSALVEIRRKSSAVGEVLGSEQMSRQGDSDAASSLRRVTGLTLMAGKYVYVRGLGERYSAVQMNELSLPSPEPSRRVVPLDLFPSSILESIFIQKSFTSNLPAEFGGGLVQLKTKSIPKQFFAQVSVGQQVDDSADRLSYRGGASDWTGRDDGTRELPNQIKQAMATGRKLVERNASNPDGFTKEELRQMGDSLNKNYNLSRTSASALPSLSMGIGNSWGFGPWNLGVASSLLHNSEMEKSSQKSASVDSPQKGSLEITEEGKTETSSAERKLGGTLSLGAQYLKDQSLSLTLIGLRHSTDEVSVKESSGSAVNDASRRRTRTEWAEREMVIKQLRGEHKIVVSESFPIDVVWRMGEANSKRDAPDSKEYTYRQKAPTDSYQLDPDVSGNLRTYSFLADTTSERSADLSFPLNFVPGESFKLKLGTGDVSRERRSDTFRLQYVKDYISGQEPDLTREPDVIFSERDKWILINQTGTADSYSGTQSIRSYFFQSDWAVHPQWDVVIGARQEESLQEVKTFYYFAPTDAQSVGSIETTNVLPSYALVWKPTEKIRARLAYSETVSRPDFRELSMVRYIDEDTGYEARGNNQLKNTVIHNVDHRWEYYFTPDEYISLGVFQKRFVSPVEDVFLPMAGGLLKIPQNALGAENKGAEFESRVNLRYLSRNLRRWSVITNYSLIESKVEIDPSKSANLTTKDRPLQGQSPYVFNFQLQYERQAQGTTGTLLYNVIGPRITEVGTDFRPDIYEQPFHQVDLVIGQKWKRLKGSFNFKAKNILDPEVKALQGDKTVRSFYRGRAFSVGYTMTL